MGREQVLQAGEPLTFEGNDKGSDWHLGFYPLRQDDGARVIVVRASPGGVYLERDDAIAVRAFLNLWLAEPYEEGGQRVHPDRSQDIEAVRGVYHVLAEEYRDLVRAWATALLSELGEPPRLLDEAAWREQCKTEGIPDLVVDTAAPYGLCEIGTCDKCGKRAPLKTVGLRIDFAASGQAHDRGGEQQVCAWGCES